MSLPAMPERLSAPPDTAEITERDIVACAEQIRDAQSDQDWHERLADVLADYYEPASIRLPTGWPELDEPRAREHERRVRALRHLRDLWERGRWQEFCARLNAEMIESYRRQAERELS